MLNGLVKAVKDRATMYTVVAQDALIITGGLYIWGIRHSIF